MLKHGLYESVINELLKKELAAASDKVKKCSPIDETEASRILAKYVAEVIEKALDNIYDKNQDDRSQSNRTQDDHIANLQTQINIINKIIRTLIDDIGNSSFAELLVDKQAKQLLAFIDPTNTIYAIDKNAEIIRPETSIAQSSLFTGAVHEPSMVSEMKKEILSADRIDMLISFIRWSGLRLLLDELQTFTQKGGQLRIITTSYMGATQIKAIEELIKLQNTEIKLSYDTKRTRLHAKTYVFYRDSGFTTAYIGSSNLSNAAISSGLEWNVKATAKDMTDTIKKIDATFESYWNSKEFETYSQDDKNRLQKALKAERYRKNDNDILPFAFDITPYPFQQEILEKLNAERLVRGHYKNLIVAATGTGKTVISAFDYKRFCLENPKKSNRLLFIAHREEILKQSISCFRGVLKNAEFGELFVGSYRPDNIDHLFLSVQTFHSQLFHTMTTPDFYDFIVVDEFHHALQSSITYSKLLSYYKPKVFLGLTATPERMDGKNIAEYFDNRFAAEIRLPEAIERKLLSPFQYFGVTDTVDLQDLKWAPGGYDRSELTKVYTLNRAVAERRANMIIESILRYVADIDDVKGLGFCVSVEHAKFMTAYFDSHGIPSICLYGDSNDEERRTAKDKLLGEAVRFIFVVDIYNEGVDIPEVNTVLFLRPTESLTVFLQQLGRGLRLAENKECLTVLDFIGQANKKYNFEDKFAALLANTHRGMQREIKDGFVSVPKGCYIQLEKKPKEIILENIRSSFSARAGLISRIATFTEDTNLKLNLTNLTEYYHIDVRSIYKIGSFSRLCVSAGLKEEFTEPLEQVMTKAFARICAIDSRRWITFLIDALNNPESLYTDKLNDLQNRMLQMFHYTVWQKSVEKCGFRRIIDGLMQIKANPVLYAELLELLQFNYDHIDFIDEPVDVGFDCPLDLHCSYTRDQILVAMDYMQPSTMQAGVKYLPDKKLDLFLITLNKSDKDYSERTMYDDYSVNETQFHWQSQSTTPADSPTGQRYIHHKKEGNRVLLFVREYKNDIAGVAPYTFLGLADYERHNGSKPMNIVWKLHCPIPAKYLKKTNKLMVG